MKPDLQWGPPTMLIGKQLKADAVQAQVKSPPPDSVDLGAIRKLITKVYMGEGAS